MMNSWVHSRRVCRPSASRPGPSGFSMTASAPAFRAFMLIWSEGSPRAAEATTIGVGWVCMMPGGHPVHAGQAHVHQDDIGLHAAADEGPFGRAGDRGHPQARIGVDLLQIGRNDRGILDNQHPDPVHGAFDELADGVEKLALDRTAA